MAKDGGGDLYCAPAISLDNQFVKPPILNTISKNHMFGDVQIYLNKQKVVADTGSLLWMDADLELTTGIYGTCMNGCGRACAGESCCMNTYSGEGLAVLSFVLPGQVVHFLVNPGTGWIFSRGAFIAGSDGLTVTARFAGCCASIFSGEGMFLTKVSLPEDASQPGQCWAGGYGAIDRHTIQGGQALMIDNGLFFAADKKQKIQVTWVGGVKQACFSGEGLVMQIYGPSTVYTQNRDPSIFRPPEDTSGGVGDPLGS